MLLSFVEFHVKPINLDGTSKSSAVILDFWILQGSIATQLRGDGRPYNGYIESFLGICLWKNLNKNGLRLPKLWSKVKCIFWLTVYIELERSR